MGKVPKPQSEPPSPSMSRSSTPAPSDVEDNLDNEDEADSEEERDVLSRKGSDDEGDEPAAKFKV